MRHRHRSGGRHESGKCWAGGSESFETLEQWAARLHPDDKDRVFGQLAAHIETEFRTMRIPAAQQSSDYRWIRGADRQCGMSRRNPSNVRLMQEITDRKWPRGAANLTEKLRQASKPPTQAVDWNTETNEVSLSREWKRQLVTRKQNLRMILRRGKHGCIPTTMHRHRVVRPISQSRWRLSAGIPPAHKDGATGGSRPVPRL